MHARPQVLTRVALWTWPPLIALLISSPLPANILVWVGAGLLGWTLVLTEFIVRRIRRLESVLDDAMEAAPGTRLPGNLGGIPDRIASRVNALLDHIDATRRELDIQRSSHENVLRQLPDPLIITDAERRILMANPAAERAFRYAPGALIGLSASDLYRCREDLESAEVQFSEQPRGKNPEPICVYLRRGDESEFPAELTRAVVHDERGQIVSFVGHVRDISRRRRKEQAHAQQRAILERIVRGDGYESFLAEIAATAQTYDMTLRCALYSWDAVHASFRAEVTSAVSPRVLETLSASGCLDGVLARPADKADLVFDLDAIRKTERTAPLADALAAAGYALLSLDPIRGFDRETIGAVVTFYADSEQIHEAGREQARAIANLAGIALGYHRRERQLHDQQLALHLLKRTAIVANTADSVSDALRACAFEVIDLLGFELAHVNVLDRELLDENESSTWVSVDRGAAGLQDKVHDLPSVAVTVELGDTPIWIDDLERVLTPAWSEVLGEEGFTRGLLLPLGRADYPTASLEFYGRTPVLAAPLTEVMPSVAEQLDIVIARKRAEATLVAARDASDQAAQAKSDFLANMSHEIRTPMNGVIGMTALLAESELTEEQNEWVATVKTSSEALLGIINDILDFSKVEAGKLSLEPLQFELRDLVNNVVDLLRPWANEKSITLDARFDANAPTCLIGDPGRIRQVLTNLVNNAVKFTQQGRVLVKVDDVGSTVAEARLKISVVDTGPGIPRDALRDLFEKFVQADGSTTRRFGGTGLGLAISKQLTELMGGNIGVESTETVGSTFWFTLNLPARVECPTTRHGFTGTRVVVLKDNQVHSRQQTCHLIDLMYRWSLSVSEADSIERAITLLEQGQAIGNPFQIVVLQHHHSASIDALIEPAKRTHTALVVLTEDQAAASQPGVHILAPPVEQSHLLDLIATVWESLPGEQSAGGDPVPPEKGLQAPATAGSPTPPLRVLVVEDNVVNQKVAIGMLRRLGCEVEVAVNGLKALEALEIATFDIIFMDCQMPEMDGYAATAEIRRREAAGTWSTWGGRMPIVAMTANALQGDRDKCLDAGMDDYVSKPAKSDVLDEMLTRWVRGIGPVPAHSAPSRANATAGAADPDIAEPPLSMVVLDELREVVGEGLPAIVSGFLEDTPRCLDGIDAGVEQQRPDTVATLAHQLKSSSASLGAERLSWLTRNLESAARAGDIEATRAIAKEAAQEFRRVNDALLAHVPEARPGAQPREVA